MVGESSRLSLIAPGSLTKAAFGNESAEGVGAPEFQVTQKTESGLTAFVAVHPAGSAGTVTPSKFSRKIVVGFGHGGVGVEVGVGVGAIVAVAVAVGVGDAVAVAVAVDVAVAVGVGLEQMIPSV